MSCGLTNCEDGSGGNVRRTRRICVLSTVVLVLTGLVLWKYLPSRNPTASPFVAQGLNVVDTIVHLSTASFKRVDFTLPCRGKLLLELACEEESNINVFVVSQEELAKMNANQAFAHLDGFDGQLRTKYRRTAQLTPGKYCLVLMDKSSGSLGSARASVQVRAHLSDLN